MRTDASAAFKVAICADVNPANALDVIDSSLSEVITAKFVAERLPSCAEFRREI